MIKHVPYKPITADRLRFDKMATHFYPGGPIEDRPEGAPDIDGAFSAATLRRGQGFISIGTLPHPVDIAPMGGGGPFPAYNVNDLVIKAPGSNEHILPFELISLEVFMMGCAMHQYMYSPDAKDKVCYLTFRSYIIKPDMVQIGQEAWHTHKNPTPGVINVRMKALDIPLRSLMQSARVDPAGISSLYMASDIACTLVQAAPATNDMDVVETDYSYTVDKIAFEVAKTKPYEIVHGNNYTFHRADAPSPDEIGQPRHFMQIVYAPVI